MLPKQKRLNLKKDFKWVSSGKRIETASFRLFLKNGDNPLPLVGIALSSKNFKTAVLRNRAKRISSKTIESLYPRLQTHLNLVIMPKPGVLESSQEALTKQLNDVQSLFASY